MSVSQRMGESKKDGAEGGGFKNETAHCGRQRGL